MPQGLQESWGAQESRGVQGTGQEAQEWPRVVHQQGALTPGQQGVPWQPLTPGQQGVLQGPRA